MSAENAAVLPETLTNDLADGVYRADVQGNGLSVLKEGENFFVVEPTTRHISRALGLEELTSTLRGVRSEVAAEGRLALKKDASGKTYVSVDSTKIDASQSPKQIISVLSDVVRTKFTDFVQVNGQKIGINQRAAKEWVASRDASALMRMDNQKFLDKANAFENADEILQAARDYIGEARKHTRKDNFVEFARGVVTFEVEGRGYDADVIVGTTKSGVALLYDLVNIQDKKITTGESDTAQDRRHETPAADISITENAEKSNSFAEKNSANDANSDTSANLEGATPPPQAVPRPSQGADRKSEQGAVQKSAQEAEDDGKARRAEIAIDVWARENIPDYAGLNAPARGAVRATVRNARAHGISNEEVLVYARVAARSGLNISFDAAQAAGGDARFDGRNTVYVNPNAPAARIQSKLMLHEGGHALFFKTKSGKKLLARAVEMADAKTAAEVREQYTKYYEKQNVDKSVYEPIIEEEIAAAGLESALGVDGAWEFILSKRPTAGEKLLSFFRGAARDYAGVGELSAEARKLLRTYQKAFAELAAYNQGNNALTGINGEKVQVSETKKAADDGGRLALPDGVNIVDPHTVTEQDVRTLLENAYRKKYNDGTYIPVRINTPQVLISAAAERGDKIANLPFIMQVGKVRQAMSNALEWAKEGHFETRAHELTTDDIISIIRAMDAPKKIIYQGSDGRYVEVVEFQTATKEEAIAVIEIGENKNPVYLNGYKGGTYQVLVTTLKPDDGYVESLTRNKSNKVVFPKKKKGASQRGSGNSVPSHLNDSPFAISIPDSNSKSNTFSEKSSAKSSTNSQASGDPQGRLALPKDTKSATAAGRVDVHAARREQQASGKTDANTVARKSADTITMSKGRLAALQANYHGDKVFAKKDVAAAMKGVEAFMRLPAELRNEFINHLWTGYNKRLHAQGFELFTEIMWHQLHATIMQEVGYDELGDMTEAQYADAERVMDEQIVAALHQIVASGKPSIKHKLENATSTEGYRQQANYWRANQTPMPIQASAFSVNG